LVAQDARKNFAELATVEFCRHRALLALVRDELMNGDYLKVWLAVVERGLRERRSSPTVSALVRKLLGEVEAKLRRLVEALVSVEAGSETRPRRLGCTAMSPLVKVSYAV
jgi:hypothetical protein